MFKKSELKVKIALIKKELPKSKNSPEGFHRAKYYFQILSLDNFVLEEREATDWDRAFFDKYQNKE